VIAARPSVGKTSFGLTLSRNAAGKRSVFFVSLEQASAELGDRTICAEAKVDSQKYQHATLSSDEVKEAIKANEIAQNYHLFIEDCPGQTMTRIAAAARRHKKQHGIGLVVVDYLQRIQPENRRMQRHEQVADISSRLKALARELAVPVVSLAQ